MEFRGHTVHCAACHCSMEGDLTIAGTTLPVTLIGDFLREDVYPFSGGRRLGFIAHARIDRRAFGVVALPPIPGAMASARSKERNALCGQTVAKAVRSRHNA
ncbi:YceI family protein [Streptomyces sp. NPDC051219]|uniref:YceI family protein n=1 Tax=Streptomyces sp. NPDC051219 TaxID=3155283 RepID=UPI0034169F23